MGKKAPKAPDAAQTAATQAQYNDASAQKNINMNSLNRTGPGGSSTFQKDANGNVTGLSNALSPELQPGWDAGAGAASTSMGLLPTTGINFDTTSAPAIAQQNYDAYGAMTAPQRAQAQKSMDTMLSDRGLPLGSEIDNDVRGNFTRNNAIADTNAAAQAWNAAPGMQSQITNNQITQHNAPITQASGELGLLNGLNGLTPQAQQAQGTTQAPNYAQLAQNQYQAQMDQYNAKMGGLGQLASTGLGLLTAPMTGGASLFGTMAGNLFNSAKPASGYGNSWDPMVTQYG